MTYQVVQTLTGHGRFSQYLFRFKLRNSPYFAYDPTLIQDVLHVFKDCDMFLRMRTALKVGIGVRISKRHFSKILEDSFKRKFFLDFCGMIVKRCNRINQ
ncbi:hypothetical protein EVAR_3815_1 [Eumeta japonica]|uniref:Uncharacterized protein n=1 Tax=Eumeta variegata TaxID=151549 RepID=A0A4C1SRZ8_EUMVA|nr:hypothetical protein EVAR_3815_1 [Eumeta japonica]